MLAVAFEGDLDLFAAGGHLGDFGLHADFLEMGFGIALDGPDQVGVGPGQDGVQSFNHHDFAAEGGVDGAQFHADVAAANDQQVGRDLLELERVARSHHARVAQIKRLRHGGFGTDRQDGLLELDELLALRRSRRAAFAGSSKYPRPCSTSTPRLWARPRTPSPSLSRMDSFQARIFVEIDVGRREVDAREGWIRALR